GGGLGRDLPFFSFPFSAGSRILYSTPASGGKPMPPADAPPPATTSFWDHFLWVKLLNRYQWFVLVVAALGWLFDTMDQQLFVLARSPALTELLGGNPPQAGLDEYGGYAPAHFSMRCA